MAQLLISAAVNIAVGFLINELFPPPDIDCAGLIIAIAHMLDLTDKDTHSYSRRPNVIEFTNFMLEAGCTQLRNDGLEHGDIIRFNTQGWPVHLGVYEVDDKGQEWYIHAFLPHKKARAAVKPSCRN